MMSGMLSRGDAVRGETSGISCRIEELLGAGGQGEVYRVQAGHSDMALKWYYQQSATAEQRSALQVLISRGSPDTRFLWPIELVSSSQKSGFGYLMALRDPRYKAVADLLARRVSPSFQTLASAGAHLASGFLQLHALGLCYRDISQGNVFFDSDSGDILICDNDNVGLDSQLCAVVGTPRFMAPEIVRSEAMPSTRTDLFSLSVLLFLMLMNHHPLEGSKEAEIHCFDLAAMTRIYGTDPVFIFDPSNQANRPLPGYQDNAIAFWKVYPAFLKDLFTKAFTDGLRDPEHGRIRESTWRSAMSRVRDQIVYCGCGAENIYDADRAPQAGTQSCWNCGTAIPSPPQIIIGRQTIILNKDSKLFAHHINDGDPVSFAAPVAEVSRHPANPDLWGLKNMTGKIWTITGRSGNIRQVNPGQSVGLADGVRVHFGSSEGEIKF